MPEQGREAVTSKVRVVRSSHWKILEFKDLSASYRKHWKLFLDKYELAKRDLIELYGKRSVLEFKIILMPFIENILRGRLCGVRIVAKRSGERASTAGIIHHP